MRKVPARSVHSVVAENLHILSAGDSSAPSVPLRVSALLFRVISVCLLSLLLCNPPPPLYTYGLKAARNGGVLHTFLCGHFLQPFL